MVGTMSERATPSSLRRTRPRPIAPASGCRSVVAVALAGVVLGGLGGFGIHAATDGDGRDGRMGRFGPGGGFQERPRRPRRPGWLPRASGPVPQPSQAPGQDS